MPSEARLAATRAEVERGARPTSRPRHGPLVAVLRLVARPDRRAEDVLATRRLATTSSSSAAGCPAEPVAELRAALERDVGPDVVVVERPPDERPADDAPVAMANGASSRAFEPLASFVAVPRYGTIDPTPLLAITLPAFVGLMVGDVGLRPRAAGAPRRWPAGAWRRAGRGCAIVWPVGLAAVASDDRLRHPVRGVLRRRPAPALGHRAALVRPRARPSTTLLVLALAIGVAQVGLGLVLGIVNAHAACTERREVVGRAALLVSLVADPRRCSASPAACCLSRSPVSPPRPLVVALVDPGRRRSGSPGRSRSIGVVGNVLSYARLMAIGLASVMLALVANRLGGLLENAVARARSSPALFHALNIGLGFFDASIQGLRLHYVEFFSQVRRAGRHAVRAVRLRPRRRG